MSHRLPAVLSDLLLRSAERAPESVALSCATGQLTYGSLQENVTACAHGLLNLGVSRGERIAVYLDKRFETVIACFGASAAGCAFVPINPLLKPDQVGHILRDCNVRVLITSADRGTLLQAVLAQPGDLRHVVFVDAQGPGSPPGSTNTIGWAELLLAPPKAAHRVIENDMTAIFYTSGSTGRPKGVIVSHRNLVAGASSVASYLENTADDVLLAALPLSFDAGFSQLTTAFSVGARVALLNYLFPRDVLKTIEKERVTGITAVPPLYIQLSELEWTRGAGEHLRYFANTGGHMPLETLTRLRRRLPHAKPYLMYGLTEAFRSTFLPPTELDRRPGSIGKAIPNAEVLVLREDGTLCGDDEPGELVHRGPLVSLGYWNAPEKTAERFKPLPAALSGAGAGATLPEIAVFSGDFVRRDNEGFLYFIGRHDGMIKTSGYRVSPTEVEEVIYSTGLVSECAAFGRAHERLGQSIAVVVVGKPGVSITPETLLSECRTRMPTYMIPESIEIRTAPLPRNPNGKVDRTALAASGAPSLAGQTT